VWEKAVRKRHREGLITPTGKEREKHPDDKESKWRVGFFGRSKKVPEQPMAGGKRQKKNSEKKSEAPEKHLLTQLPKRGENVQEGTRAGDPCQEPSPNAVKAVDPRLAIAG